MKADQIFEQARKIAEANRAALAALPRRERPGLADKVGSVAIAYYLNGRLDFRFVSAGADYKGTRADVLREIGALMSLDASISSVTLLQQIQSFGGRWYVLPVPLDIGVSPSGCWPDWQPVECYG